MTRCSRSVPSSACKAARGLLAPHEFACCFTCKSQPHAMHDWDKMPKCNLVHDLQCRASNDPPLRRVSKAAATQASKSAPGAYKLNHILRCTYVGSSGLRGTLLGVAESDFGAALARLERASLSSCTDCIQANHASIPCCNSRHKPLHYIIQPQDSNCVASHQ